MNRFAAMLMYFSRHIIQAGALFMTLIFTVSLFWCLDADCLQSNEGHDNDCASLICSVISQQKDTQEQSSPKAFHHECSCSCVCHIPALLEERSELHSIAYLDHTSLSFIPPLLFSSTRPLYRPPII